MILGFKQKFLWEKPTHFKEKILAGEKKHTIRTKGKRKYKVGMVLHMAYGVRTKFYECFCDKHRFKSEQEIKIVHSYWLGNKISTDITIDDKFIYHDGIIVGGADSMLTLANNDGFDSIDDFFRWFNKDFEGVIVHWTDLRY